MVAALKGGAVEAYSESYIARMPTLGLKLPLRICVFDDAACIEDAGGRRTGFVAVRRQHS